MSAPSLCKLTLGSCALLLSAHGLAADGLLPPADTAPWPSLTARIAIQTAAVSPLSLRGLADAGQGFQSGALLGDYVFFSQAALGSFRATSGLLFGSRGDVPSFGSGPLATGSRLGISVSQGALRSLASQGDAWQAAPYLGLGFSSPLGSSSFSLSADLGWVAENASTAPAALRAPLGLQGSDSQRRAMRLSPLLQFGMRYTF